MTDLVFHTPRQALYAMIAAGAVFTAHRRADSLRPSFIYRVSEGGDLQRCRAIIAAVKAKPPQFWSAFEAHVAETVERRTS